MKGVGRIRKKDDDDEDWGKQGVREEGKEEGTYQGQEQKHGEIN